MIYCLWKFEFIITYADALPRFIPLRFVRNFFLYSVAVYYQNQSLLNFYRAVFLWFSDTYMSASVYWPAGNIICRTHCGDTKNRKNTRCPFFYYERQGVLPALY